MTREAEKARKVLEKALASAGKAGAKTEKALASANKALASAEKAYEEFVELKHKEVNNAVET